jgi:transcriptional regulator with XRE-family HTH domain
MSTDDNFGALLRRYRLMAGLTQQELAARAGLSARAISDMERGRTGRPYLRSLRMLADVLDMRPEDEDRFHAAVRGRARQGAARAAATALVPHQLPVGIRRLVGRGAELTRLSAIRRGGGRSAAAAAAITGMGGVGKTALAVYWAHQAARNFPDGQIYVDLHGFCAAGEALDTAETLRICLDGLGVSVGRRPDAVQAQLGLYRSLLAGKRVLILLDNVRDEQQIRPLLPGAGSMMVATSRRTLAGLAAVDGVAAVNLDVLSSAQSHQFLRLRLGAGRTSAAGAVTELAEACAGLPLALSIVAARAGAHPHLPLEALAAELGEDRHRLDALAISDGEADPRTVFSWSFRYLSDPAAQLFRLLGLHPGPSISASAAASLARADVGSTRRLLRELADANLVAEAGLGRFALHPLLCSYAIEQGQTHDPETTRAEARGRMLDHYLHSAEHARQLLYPGERQLDLPSPRPGTVPERFVGRQEAREWLAAEHRVLVAVAMTAAATGQDEMRTALLTQAVMPFLQAQRHWQDQILVQDALLTALRRAGPGQRAGAYLVIGSRPGEPDGYRQVRGALAQTLRLLDQLGDETAGPEPGAPAPVPGPRSPAGAPARPVLDSGCLHVDLYRHLVTVYDRPVNLTSKEFRILAVLAAEPGRVFTREFIMAQVWGHDNAGDTRTLRVHISLLRKKLGVPDLIETVHGTGFRLVRRDLCLAADILPLSDDAGQRKAA